VNVRAICASQAPVVKKVPVDLEQLRTSSVERGRKSWKGESNGIRATPGWERARVQIDSGMIDTVGPKDIAKAFEAKETMVSRIGVGYVAADGSSIKNYGEKTTFGFPDDGEGVSVRLQCANVM
jgi:hypothetical protein